MELTDTQAQELAQVAWDLIPSDERAIGNLGYSDFVEIGLAAIGAMGLSLSSHTAYYVASDMAHHLQAIS